MNRLSTRAAKAVALALASSIVLVGCSTDSEPVKKEEVQSPWNKSEQEITTPEGGFSIDANMKLTVDQQRAIHEKTNDFLKTEHGIAFLDTAYGVRKLDMNNPSHKAFAETLKGSNITVDDYNYYLNFIYEKAEKANKPATEKQEKLKEQEKKSKNR